MSENREKQTGKRNPPRSAWSPGQSGNPGGRPKVAAEVRDLAREYAGKAIKRLVGLMDSKNQPVALRAAEAVLDRGYGRPLQAMKLPEDPQEKPRSLDLTKFTIVYLIRGAVLYSSANGYRYAKHFAVP